MSAKWAPKRIEIRKTHKSFWYNQFSAVGKYGSGAIMQRIAETIETNGGEIHKNHKVIGLEKKENKISRIIFEDQEALDVEASIIISTLPITVTCELLGHKPNLQFNAYILVYVVVKQDQVFEDEIQSVYFAHDESHFHRVTEQKKYSNTGFPDGVTLLCFEISYRVRPHLEEMSEEDLSREVFCQFCDMGFADKNDYLKGWTRKFPNINPIMTLGFEEELSKATSITTSFENLHSCGGSAEFTYGDMQVMFARAEDLVELLTSEHYKINRNLKVGAPFQFNKVVKVGNYKVGGDNPTLIIAEIGINHQGSTEIATDLIKEAKLIGCEYAKIQTYVTDERISPTAKSAKYTDKTLSMEETTYEMFERLELGPESHRTLFNYANKIGMPLISTPFDEKSVDILMDYNIDAFKIASFDAFNLPLIKYIASKGLPIILSTGMCGMSEIEEALEIITSQGNKNVILLHCVSSYPTDAKDVNLRAITSMQQAFQVPVGYSDHTIGSTVSKAAMSIGAHVLEKHFTLNVNYEGADHILSAEPEEMEDIVNSRDIIFSAMGSGVKKPRSVENTSINLQRKSIFTKKLIKKGELISLDNITIKGPGHGLLPKYLDLILGKKVTSDISSDEPITWDVLLDS
jgi:sialic acid synthase SpsE